MPVIINGTTGLSGVSTVNLANGSVTQNILANGVAGTGPAFSAYLSSALSISTGTWTKLPCNTEEWDTANCYDNTTNYRFTPNVAGYYQVNGQVGFANTIAGVQSKLLKNGTDTKHGANLSGAWSQLNCVIYLNGTTDYIEYYVAQVQGTTQALFINSNFNYFQAFLARAA
jgi:hypothetical protein